MEPFENLFQEQEHVILIYVGDEEEGPLSPEDMLWLEASIDVSRNLI
ncbi:MAG: hypothetical protein ABSD81_02060 [Methanomicrobiales archaeon]|jgi:hypothetical protein